MIPQEIWKDIPSYKNYQVSNTGRVKSKYRIQIRNNRKPLPVVEKILKPFNAERYLKVKIRNDEGVVKNPTIHRLVMIAFCPTSDNTLDINHIDGNIHNNNLSNLEWCTHEENINHSYSIGHHKPKYGDESHFSKLTKDQAMIIKYERKQVKTSELCKEFGVEKSCINRIKSGKIWKHI